MRLTEKQISVIKEAFTSHFLDGDKLWLFGSRVDDLKKGGDIDLYIETMYEDEIAVTKKRIRFSVDIQKKIGEQKIDIIINMVKLEKLKRIYDEARNTGVQLI